MRGVYQDSVLGLIPSPCVMTLYTRLWHDCTCTGPGPY